MVLVLLKMVESTLSSHPYLGIDELLAGLHLEPVEPGLVVLDPGGEHGDQLGQRLRVLPDPPKLLVREVRHLGCRGAGEVGGGAGGAEEVGEGARGVGEVKAGAGGAGEQGDQGGWEGVQGEHGGGRGCMGAISN